MWKLKGVFSIDSVIYNFRMKGSNLNRKNTSWILLFKTKGPVAFAIYFGTFDLEIVTRKVNAHSILT